MIGEIKIKLTPKDIGAVYKKIPFIFEYAKIKDIAYLKIFNITVYAKMGDKIALFGRVIK